jgi:hypothetical protein
MSAPKQVMILGRRVKLQFTDLQDGDFGEFSELPLTIKIQQGLSPEIIPQVLIHEMVHAALAISGISTYQLEANVEEAICTVMETAVPDIMKALKRMKVEDFEDDE